MKKRFIGVIGGLGTDATIRFLENLNSFDYGGCDKDRRKILLYNNPEIPSRYLKFAGGDEDVKEAMLASIKLLEDAGVDFIAIPCNTVHYFHEDFQQQAAIPILHISEETRDACLKESGKDARIGILASQKTIATGLYQNAFAEEGVDVFTPRREIQPLFDRAIDHVKRNDMRDFTMFARAVRDFQATNDLNILVLGCTELGLIPLAAYPEGVRLFDSNYILAERAYQASIKND